MRGGPVVTMLAMAALAAMAGCSCGGSVSSGDAATGDLTARDLTTTTLDLTSLPDLRIPPTDLTALGDAAIEPDDLTAEPADLTPPPVEDLTGISVTGMLGSVMIWQDCMPIIAADPVQITATLKLTNTGTVDVGPIDVSDGQILKSLSPIATFHIVPMQTPIIPPGQSATVTITKQPGTLLPANGCSTLGCNSAVQLSIPYSGPNVPQGNRAVSGLTQVSCTF